MTWCCRYCCRCNNFVGRCTLRIHRLRQFGGQVPRRTVSLGVRHHHSRYDFWSAHKTQVSDSYRCIDDCCVRDAQLWVCAAFVRFGMHVRPVLVRAVSIPQHSSAINKYNLIMCLHWLIVAEVFVHLILSCWLHQPIIDELLTQILFCYSLICANFVKKGKVSNESVVPFVTGFLS